VKGGKKEQKTNDTSPSQKNGTQSVSQKSVRTIMFQSPRQLQETFKKREKDGT